MWDDRWKVGVLNDFYLARFRDRRGVSGQDNTGTLPFIVLDLLLVKGLGGEIHRHYQHEAESFAWCIICLHFATVEDSKGNNHTRSPHPLLEWFQGWQRSRNAKKALEWDDNDTAGTILVHPIYHRQFFHLQPSSILITLVLANDPSPTSIPACPTVFRLTHNSRSLPHNLA